MRISSYPKLSRWIRHGAVLASSVAMAALGAAAADAQNVKSVAPMTIVINQSPWFPGFQKLVQYYEETTGNEVTLDVNPFAGSVEKQRSSARAPKGTIDLFVTNAIIMPEIWASGLIHTMDELDPDFELEPEVLRFDDTVCWDARKESFDCSTGKLVGVPINPNVQMLFYRTDLYEQNSLEVPETFDGLLANATALHNPPQLFGVVQRGARAACACSVSFNFQPYLEGFGGSIFADPKEGDYTVTLDSEAARGALQFYVDMAAQAGHPNTGSIAQGDMIQLFATGKAGHIIGVIAAFDQLDDPDKSVVAGNFSVAVLPAAAGQQPRPTLGHFISAIPKNIPEERKLAAVEFLKWFQTREAQKKYAEFGAPPVRADVLRSDLAEQDKFRWMRPLADAIEVASVWWDLPQGAEVAAVWELRLNQTITGEISVDEAINQTAQGTFEIATDAGLKTGLAK